MTTKKCTTCSQDKDLSMFAKDASRNDGLRRVCRSCRSVQQKEGRKRNPRSASGNVKPEAAAAVTAQPRGEIIARVEGLQDEIAYTFDLIKNAPHENARQAFTDHGLALLLKGAEDLLSLLNEEGSSQRVICNRLSK